MGDIVFITGATGFVGSHIANQVLRAGYRVRLSVRKEQQMEKLKGVFHDHAQRTEYVIVPNITLSDAFDDMLDGVRYIVHVASPLSGGGPDAQKDFVDPAVKGTVAILEAARKVPTVKKVIITASVASLTPMSGQPAGVAIKEDSGLDLSVDDVAKYEGDRFKVYKASKLLADQASLRFMDIHKPGFALITLHPTFVFGPSLLQKTAGELNGTNGLLWTSLNSENAVVPSAGIHVLDVAEAHVLCLGDAVEAGSRFLLSAPPFAWRDVLEFVKREFPHHHWKLQPPAEEILWIVNTSRAETVLGMDWMPVEQFVRDVVEQQLSFASKATQ